MANVKNAKVLKMTKNFSFLLKTLNHRQFIYIDFSEKIMCLDASNVAIREFFKNKSQKFTCHRNLNQ